MSRLTPALCLAMACARGSRAPLPAASPEPTTAIVDATVLPMDSERVLPHTTVLVRGDRIVWVGPAPAAQIPAGASRVDARGAFLLPGLADLHVHTGRDDMPLFLRNGVTTIRELNGSPSLLALRDSIRDGRVPGPTMHVAGTLLAGVPQRWRHRLIRGPEEGRAAVREQVAAGYEFIKIYDGLSLESYDAILDEARRHHIRPIGHLPRTVTLEHAVAAGQTEIEHIDQLLAGTVFRDTTNWRLRVDSMARLLAANGTWVNPTLAVEEALARVGTRWYSDQLARPEMRFVDDETRSWWASLAGRRSHDSARSPAALPDDYPSARSRAIVEIKRATVRALFTAGVPLVAGTDLPNPLMVPGFAMHDELAALVRAGLRPFDALSTATRDASRLLGGDPFGVIAPGARADLIIVSGNPLEDLALLRTPESVMVRGRWISLPGR